MDAVDMVIGKVIGKVIGVHLKDEAMTDGILDVQKTLPIARCDYHQYTVIPETFEMIVPGESELMRLGMEGNAKHTHQHHRQQEKQTEV